MTREEAKLVLDSLTTWVGQERLITDEIVEAIRTLSKSSLPSNLDEAAEENSKGYYCSALETLNEMGICDGCENVKLAFKAGAEWMAGQGQTKEGIATKDYFVNFGDDTSVDLDPSMTLNPAFNINDGDKVIVQIRKK